MDFNHLKDILSSVVGTVSVKGKELAEVAVDKTKTAGRVAKVSLEITTEKEALKKAYAELGQAYFENCREGAEGVFVQLCEEIAVITERIALLEGEVEELKAGLRATAEEADVEVTFEEVVEEAEAECCCEEAPAEECCCEEQAAGTCCCEEAPAEETPAEEAPAAEEEKAE